MTIDINQYQSISINRLILIIDDQSMTKIRVVIDWYRLLLDKLISIGCRLTEWGINITSLYAVIVNTFHFDALNDTFVYMYPFPLTTQFVRVLTVNENNNII